VGDGVEPAVHVDPVAVFQREKGLTAVTEDRAHGGDTRHDGAGADADTNGVQLAELRQVTIHDRARQGRQRAHAADDGHARRARRRIEARDAAHEGATVGEIQVVAAGLDGRLCDAVGLLLERAGGVYQDLDAELAQHADQARVARIDPQGVVSGEPELVRQRGRLLRVAARENELNARIARQSRSDTAAEEAVRTEQQDTCHSFGHDFRRLRGKAAAKEDWSGQIGWWRFEQRKLGVRGS
jgi:hypothetical protein